MTSQKTGLYEKNDQKMQFTLLQLLGARKSQIMTSILKSEKLQLVPAQPVKSEQPVGARKKMFSSYLEVEKTGSQLFRA